jgi:hypothetical protein
MHRVQLKEGVMDSNHWLPTTLDDATAIKKTNLWSEFEPGSSFFSCVPHGCIGIIERERREKRGESGREGKRV